jgi:hypothetical protein
MNSVGGIAAAEGAGASGDARCGDTLRRTSEWQGEEMSIGGNQS